MRHALRGSMLSLALLLLPAAGRAQATIDPDGFATEMAERLSAETKQKITVAGPLELRGQSPGSPDPARMYLDRIYQYCQHNDAEACEASKANYIASTAETFAGMPPLTRARLRVVVRDTEYCRQIAEMLDKPANAPVIRPVAEGLCAVLMADYPRSRATVNREGLDKLKLPAAAAWLSAEAQTRPENHGMLEQLDLDANPAMLSGGDYLPSVLLDTEAWKQVAARTHGTILMAVPGEDGVYVSRLDTTGDLAGLRKLVREQYESSERGISPLLYRWTGEGWAPLQ